MKLLTLICALGIAAVASATEWTLRDINFDGVPVKLAIPSDYAPAGDDHPAMMETRRILPPTNQLIAGFYAEDGSAHFVQVQLVRDTRTWRYNRAEFEQIVTEIATVIDGPEMRKIAEEVTNDLSKRASPDVKMEQPVMLAPIDKSDHHVIFPMLMAMSTESNGQPRREVMLIACMLIVVKERLMHVFLYEPFTGPETHHVLADKAKALVRQTFEANR